MQPIPHLSAALNPESLISTYIRAKDENRPHLMKYAFALDATLDMTVKSDAIAFPTHTQGLSAISDVLVRRFGQTYDNVYTFCLADSRPDDRVEIYACDWLVGMTDKAGAGVRVGCGSYRWQFSPSLNGPLVQRLEIVIEAMKILPPEHSERAIDEWLGTLPYPWCSRAQALAQAPQLPDLDAALDYLKR